MFIFCILVWGSSYLVVKFQNNFAPSEFSLMLRLIIALLFFIPLYVIFNRSADLNKSYYIDIGIFGLCNFMTGYLLLYFATKSLSSGLVIVIFSFKSILTPILISVSKRKRPEILLILGSVVAIIGIGFLIDGALLNNTTSYVGLVFAIFGTLVTSIGDLYSSKNNDHDIQPIFANLVGLLWVMPILLIINIDNFGYIIQIKHFYYSLSILYLGIVASGIAWLFYLSLVKNIGASYASYMVTLFPVVGCILSIKFENMPFSINSLIGLFLEVCGLLLAFIKWRDMA